MEILDFFLEFLKDLEQVATSLFKNWNDIEGVSMRFLVFVENLSIAVLNKWFPV